MRFPNPRAARCLRACFLCGCFGLLAAPLAWTQPPPGMGPPAVPETGPPLPIAPTPIVPLAGPPTLIRIELQNGQSVIGELTPQQDPTQISVMSGGQLVSLPREQVRTLLSMNQSPVQAAAAAPPPPGAPAVSLDAPPPLMWPDLLTDAVVASDTLGRTLPLSAETGPRRTGKTVGIFYFLWLHDTNGAQEIDLSVNDAATTKPAGLGRPDGPYVLSKIYRENPTQPAVGPRGAFHYWGEPLFGFYQIDDAWVLRRHAALLSAAGIDFVAIDVTNSLTYPALYRKLLATWAALRAEGNPTPQIAFLANTAQARVVQQLYDELYKPGLHRDLWFIWKGKPLIMAAPDDLPPEVAEFFTFRRSWAWTKGQEWFGDGKDKWPWLDHYPQQWGWHEAPDKPEQLVVSTAQHPISRIGKSFHDGQQPPPAEQRPGDGLFFAEQWRRAHEVDPELVFITGWNEWQAQNFPSEAPRALGNYEIKPGDPMFVDALDEEFNRDIEPMRGGYTDNFYYQMAAEIRRYKGVAPLPPASPARTIDLGAGFAQWADVAPEYRDFAGDTGPRGHWGRDAAGAYIDTSGRNDLLSLKVAHDAEQLYFYARCADPLTGERSDAWMWLLIGVEGSTAPGWQGFQYLVNRGAVAETTASLEVSMGGWNWQPAGQVRYATAGAELMVAIPRAALGLAPGTPAKLRFKWLDHAQHPGDILDTYVSGDAAPDGRFAYRFEEPPPPPPPPTPTPAPEPPAVTTATTMTTLTLTTTTVLTTTSTTTTVPAPAPTPEPPPVPAPALPPDPTPTLLTIEVPSTTTVPTTATAPVTQ